MFLLLVLAVQDAEPEEPWKPGFEAGDFTFYPSARVRARFDDNIFLEDKDSDSDAIFLVTPGLGIRMKTEEVTGLFSYEYTEWYHVDETVANRDEQSGVIRLNWVPGAPYFKWGGNFDLAAQPIDTAFANLVEVRVWSGFFTFGYDFDGTRVEIDTRYMNLGTPLDALEFYEHDQWLWTAKVLHRFSDEWAGLAEFTYGRTLFFNGDVDPVKEDNDIYQPRVGAIWVVSPEVELSAIAGYQVRHYDSGNDAAAFVHDYEGGVFEAAISWIPDEENRLTGRVTRSVSESVLSNFSSTYATALIYSHIIEPGWDVSFIGTWERGHEATDAVAEALKWRYSGRAVTYYRFFDGLTGELDVEFRGKQTNDDSGEYENWRTTAGLKYEF